MPYNKKNNRPSLPANYNLPSAILDILLDLGEHSPLFESPYKHIKRLHREALGIPEPKRWRYNRAMRYLEQSENIKLVTKNDQVFIQLTKKGQIRALLSKLKNGFNKPSRWDGKWRLIAWDIPESSKNQRNKIRKTIKKLGYHQLQKSLFVTPYPIPPDAVEYLKHSGLLDYMRLIRADKIDDDQSLRKHYGL